MVTTPNLTSAEAALEGTPYRVLRRMGQGGMGEVFEVEHRHVGSLRVLKLMRQELAERADLVERMRLEAQALAALDHPNIVKVLDFGRTAAGAPYLVMERLTGCTIAEELRLRGAPPMFVALDYALQALAGLGAAHALGLVHRDVKPDNLFIHCPREGGRVIKLLDFGIAKVLDATRGAPLPPTLPTAEGLVIGTPRYLAPEQAAGRPVDARTDVYAAGLVLYAMLAGRGPFDDVEREARIVAAHISRTPDPPSRFAREPPPAALDVVVLKALAKDPDQRFPTADAFAAELVRVSHGLGNPARSALPELATELLPDHEMDVQTQDSPGFSITGSAGWTSALESDASARKRWRLAAFFAVLLLTAGTVALLVARWAA